jgi:hypothetical protein
MPELPHIFSAKARKRRTATTTWLLLVLALVIGVAALPALAQIAVRNQGYIPYSDAPIFYRSQELIRWRCCKSRSRQARSA